MNHKNKFCKNFFRKQFLPIIGSAAFKLNDLLNTFLFFILFDNALKKIYSLYGHRSGKKSFKEMKICGVIVSKWILFILKFFLLSQKINWVSSLSFPFNITNHQEKLFWKHFGIKAKNLPLKCINHVMRYWWITLLGFSFTINLSLFYVKIGELLTKTSSLSTVSRQVSIFLWSSYEFVVLILKSGFNVLRAIMKSEKCSESEALHEIGEVLGYAKDRMACLKAD